MEGNKSAPIISIPKFEEISSVIEKIKKNGKVEEEFNVPPMTISINPETTKFLIFYNITSGNPDLITNKNFDLVERIMQSPALSRAFNSEEKYIQVYDKNSNKTDEDQYNQMMNGMYSFFLKYYTFLYEYRISEGDMSPAEKKLKKYLIDVSRLSEDEKLLGKEVIIRDVTSTIGGLGIVFGSIFAIMSSQYIVQHLSNYVRHLNWESYGSFSIIVFGAVLGGISLIYPPAGIFTALLYGAINSKSL